MNTRHLPQLTDVRFGVMSRKHVDAGENVSVTNGIQPPFYNAVAVTRRWSALRISEAVCPAFQCLLKDTVELAFLKAHMGIRTSLHQVVSIYLMAFHRCLQFRSGWGKMFMLFYLLHIYCIYTICTCDCVVCVVFFFTVYFATYNPS